MNRLFDDPVEPIPTAMNLGFRIHADFRIDDLSTYPEMIDAARQYRKDTGTLCDYPCWIPEAGMVRINPDSMLDYYNRMTA